MGCGASLDGPGINQTVRDVVNCGISLRWLFDFAAKVPTEYTTCDVVRGIILPETTELRCRYVDLIPGQQHVSKPQLFISHTWADKFHHVVKSIQTFFDKDEADEGFSSIYAWMDIFAINQHGTALQEDLKGLQTILGSVEHVLFCMDQHGVALSRIWCLYELWRSVSATGEAGASKKKLVVITYLAAAPHTVLTSLNVDKAQASVEEDRVRILEDIKATIGTEELTALLRDAILDSSGLELEQAQAALAAGRMTVLQVLAVMRKREMMLDTGERHEEAMQVQIAEDELGEELAEGGEVEQAAGIAEKLASSLRMLGRHEEAAEKEQKAVSLWERYGRMPQDEPKLGATLERLGSLYLTKLQRYEEAEAALRRAAKLVGSASERQQILYHIETVLQAMDRWDEADSLRQDAQALDEEVQTEELHQEEERQAAAAPTQTLIDKAKKAQDEGRRADAEGLWLQAIAMGKKEWGYTQSMYHGKVLHEAVGGVMFSYALFLLQMQSMECTGTCSGPLVICGPSGVGKGTLISRLMEDFPDHFGFSVSHTTRDPRPGEEDGKAYHFNSRATMEAQIAAGLFLERAEVHGNLYGTSMAAVQAVSQEGKTCVMDIDVQGASKVKNSQLGPSAVFIFISPPSMEALEARLRQRGTDTEESIVQRLGNAAGELQGAQEPGLFDATIVNEDLDVAYEQLKLAIRQLLQAGALPADRHRDVVVWLARAHAVLWKQWGARHNTCTKILDIMKPTLLAQPGACKEAEQEYVLGVRELEKCYNNTELAKVKVLRPYVGTIRVLGYTREAHDLDAALATALAANPHAAEVEAAERRLADAQVLMSQGMYDEAETMLREVYITFSRAFPPSSIEISLAQAYLNSCLANKGRNVF